jgi:hypothetical protein
VGARQASSRRASQGWSGWCSRVPAWVGCSPVGVQQVHQIHQKLLQQKHARPAPAQRSMRPGLSISTAHQLLAWRRAPYSRSSRCRVLAQTHADRGRQRSQRLCPAQGIAARQHKEAACGRTPTQFWFSWTCNRHQAEIAARRLALTPQGRAPRPATAPQWPGRSDQHPAAGGAGEGWVGGHTCTGCTRQPVQARARQGRRAAALHGCQRRQLSCAAAGSGVATFANQRWKLGSASKRRKKSLYEQV